MRDVERRIREGVDWARKGRERSCVGGEREGEVLFGS